MTAEEKLKTLMDTGEFDFVKEISKENLWKLCFAFAFISGDVINDFRRVTKMTEELLSAQPEIVRCKDCNKNYNLILNSERLYCTKHKCYMYEDDFCSYAERRTDEIN